MIQFKTSMGYMRTWLNFPSQISPRKIHCMLRARDSYKTRDSNKSIQYTNTSIIQKLIIINIFKTMYFKTTLSNLMLRKMKTDMSYRSRNLFHQCHYVLITKLSESDALVSNHSLPPPLSPLGTPHSIPSMEDSSPQKITAKQDRAKCKERGQRPSHVEARRGPRQGKSSGNRQRSQRSTRSHCWEPHKNTKQGTSVSIHSLVCFEE